MSRRVAFNEKKRKRNPTIVEEAPDETDLSNLKKLKLSAQSEEDQRMHQTRSPVNSNSWASPHSPEPILCDPISPAPVPEEDDVDFAGYERFNKFLGQIHQESKIHHFRHEPHHTATDYTYATASSSSPHPN